MYHTFQASTTTVGSESSESSRQSRPAGSRRISTSNACNECRRRKIRCDGTQPCSQCSWYSHPDLCTYSKPTQRVVPSRKLVDKLQHQVDHFSSVFSRVFSGQDLETLVTLAREDLINLALALPAPSISPTNGIGETPSDPTEARKKSDGVESLEALEQAPDQDPDDDEAKRYREKLQGISDDVNGLSLSVDRQSSYVGVSSINVALKVIFKAAPIARAFLAQSYAETALPTRANSPALKDVDPDPDYLPPADVGHRLIESYFAHIHVLMPMVDEDQFWHTYLYGERRDGPWLALLNVVMSLGSLASSTSDNEDHIVYFRRARKHLDLETFGSGNLLVLQAIGLMSGYYLHWLNKPNEANALMGATLRMATALGLHREYAEGHPPTSTNGRAASRGAEVPVEIRRRTWWSLVCLDTWAYMALGRPTLGRLGPGITVQSPKIPAQMNNAQYLASLKLLPIVHNITFCKLATRIQDKLAGQSVLSTDELFALDAELVKWHDELPPILQAVPNRSQQRSSSDAGHGAGRPKSITPSAATASARNPFDFSQPPDRDNTACPEVLKTPRAIMHWWYQTLRMLMHRPVLLAAALRRTSNANMSTEEKIAVSKCRIIAGQAIEDINATCNDELVAGWNATWLMLQSVMVPLVSLFAYLSGPAAYMQSDSPGKKESDAPTGTDEDADKWRQQIETAMAFFERMQRYSVAALKSRDVVARLYDASKHVRQYHEAQYLQQQLKQSQQQQHQQPQQNPLRTFHTGLTPLPDGFSLHGQNSSNSFAGPNGGAFSPGTWGLSPNGDAAMNSFWDDMLWDSSFVPDMQDMVDPSALSQEFHDDEWPFQVGNGVDVNGDGQRWQEWEYDPR